MAFQVKDLMVALDPSRMACGAVTESQCPTASAPLLFTCGPISVDTQCSGVSAVDEDAPDSQHRLETLRRQLAAALSVN